MFGSENQLKRGDLSSKSDIFCCFGSMFWVKTGPKETVLWLKSGFWCHFGSILKEKQTKNNWGCVLNLVFDVKFVLDQILVETQIKKKWISHWNLVFYVVLILFLLKAGQKRKNIWKRDGFAIEICFWYCFGSIFFY